MPDIASIIRYDGLVVHGDFGGNEVVLPQDALWSGIDHCDRVSVLRTQDLNALLVERDELRAQFEAKVEADRTARGKLQAILAGCGTPAEDLVGLSLADLVARVREALPPLPKPVGEWEYETRFPDRKLTANTVLGMYSGGRWSLWYRGNDCIARSDYAQEALTALRLALSDVGVPPDSDDKE